VKTLLILRHGKSSWDNIYLSDYERPLNERGKRDAKRMGRLLRQMDLVPDLIITSSAERALATAERVAQAGDYEGKIRPTRDLYHADPEELIAVLADLETAFERVLVVGHNPGLENLLEDLVDGWQRMPTAALAQVALPIEQWRELDDATQGKLVNLWYPKELPDG
jgi:phosphohistidine phosphatase